MRRFVNAIPIEDPLLIALRDPAALVEMDEAAWEDLLLRARHGKVLARIGSLLEQRDLLGRIPQKTRLRLDEARVLAARNQTNVRFEVNRVVRSLRSLETSIILLKGAAYLVAGLPPAQGRYIGDLDILVPMERLSSVEQTLIAAGWQKPEITAYDDRYYREWMHEIPGLWHPDRLLVVDIHHTIVPITSRYKPDSEALFASAVPLDDPHLKILCPADMVLHSAVHLFAEEFTSGLRDLADLHDLLGYFGTTDEFWDELIARSDLHGLGRILYYLLRYSRLVYGSNIPPSAEIAARRHAPNPAVGGLMDLLVMSALKPMVPARPNPARWAASWLLLIRSHWLKMPPLLLAQHLFVKTLYRWRTRLGLTSARAQSELN